MQAHDKQTSAPKRVTVTYFMGLEACTVKWSVMMRMAMIATFRTNVSSSACICRVSLTTHAILLCSLDVLAPCFACEIRPLRHLGQVGKLLRPGQGCALDIYRNNATVAHHCFPHTLIK